MNSSFDRVPNGKEEWLTPKYITDELGPFDLDPCSPIGRPWDIATLHITIEQDGLTIPWSGKHVWLNPPYGGKTPLWLGTLSLYGDGLALVFARTETESFFPHVWDCATSIFFIKGRLNFWEFMCKTCGQPNSWHYSVAKKSACCKNFIKLEGLAVEGEPAGAPSVLIAYGEKASAKLEKFKGRQGKFVRLK